MRNWLKASTIKCLIDQTPAGRLKQSGNYSLHPADFIARVEPSDCHPAVGVYDQGRITAHTTVTSGEKRNECIVYGYKVENSVCRHTTYP